MKGSWLVLMLLLADGCAEVMTYDPTLKAPPGTASAVTAAVEEGNRLYRQRKWEAARAQYEAAIKAQPGLAEAHYNLALVLEILEGDEKARPHYIEAANLAPGHQVIWNSPPLRRHGDVESGSKPSRPLVTPAMGVH
jgi:tetratricopeptide (TPR) repeat protein